MTTAKFMKILITQRAYSMVISRVKMFPIESTQNAGQSGESPTLKNAGTYSQQQRRRQIKAQLLFYRVGKQMENSKICPGNHKILIFFNSLIFFLSLLFIGTVTLCPTELTIASLAQALKAKISKAVGSILHTFWVGCYISDAESLTILSSFIGISTLRKYP